MALNLTPVKLWEEKKETWEGVSYDPVLEKFSKNVLSHLIKARKMGMMTEIKRLRKVGGVVNHSAMADAFTQDLIKRIFK